LCQEACMNNAGTCATTILRMYFVLYHINLEHFCFQLNPL
jgi:hypothetical protein